MVATASPGRVWFRDFGYYALRWTIIVGVLSALQPVYDIPADASNLFWQMKLQQLLLGIGWGFVVATVFTVIQNGVNSARRRPVSWVIAIAVWIAMAFLGALLTGRFSQRASTPVAVETPAAREKSLQKAAETLNKEFDEMRARAAKEQPDRPPSYVVADEMLKKGEAKLAAATTPAKKADVAADQFIGFYFVNTKTRAAYCNTLGVDITSFVKAFAEDHAGFYQKSRQIHNRDPHGADQIEAGVYKMIEPQMQQFVAEDMKEAAKQNNVTEKRICEVFAENAREIAKEFALSAVNPTLYKAMMEAK